MGYGYSASIIGDISKADDTYEMKQALVKGLNEFRTYKREAIIAVKDFGYGDDILDRVKKAETMRDVTIIMNEARRHFNWEDEGSVEVYDKHINKEAKTGKIR